MDSTFPLGVFDSGVGGLSVLRALRAELPHEDMIYLADQAHVPYGSRSLDEVRAFAGEITRFLIARGAKLVAVACNTASAAALHWLRQCYPETPFVGMEPAVKPAAETTRSGVVGVLATPATFQGALYAVNDYSADNNTDVWGPVIARQIYVDNSTVNHYVPIGSLLTGMPATYSTTTALQNEPGTWGS